LNVLLIESSFKSPEFGYVRNGEFIIKKKLDSESNADSLIYEIKSEFIRTGNPFKDIEAVSLSNGPGSFTGLKIGSVIAKGICIATGCKLIEINTLDLVANKYPERSENLSIRAAINTNSKSREFYFADYRFEGRNINVISDYGTGTIEEIGGGGIILVLNEKIQESFPEFTKTVDVSLLSSAEAQFRLTARKIENNEFTDFEKSEPNYMKRFEPLKSGNKKI